MEHVINYIIYIMHFRMVAERLHYRLREALRGVLREILQHIPERVKRTCLAVYSALPVEPTYLDPTSGSTRYCDDINMLIIQQQRQRQR
eukprot:5303785-Amphidinium_carterae.1